MGQPVVRNEPPAFNFTCILVIVIVCVLVGLGAQLVSILDWAPPAQTETALRR